MSQALPDVTEFAYRMLATLTEFDFGLPHQPEPDAAKHAYDAMMRATADGDVDWGRFPRIVEFAMKPVEMRFGALDGSSDDALDEAMTALVGLVAECYANTF